MKSIGRICLLAGALAGPWGCGDDFSQCDGYEVIVDTADSSLGEYWLRQLSETEWRPALQDSTGKARLCVNEDYALISRCGDRYREHRRTLSDSPALLLPYCGPERDDPTARLTVEVNQPGSISVLGTTQTQAALNWSESFELRPYSYDVVAISRYGDFLRERVEFSAPSTLSMDFASAVAPVPLTLNIPDPESDESMLLRLELVTDRGTRAYPAKSSSRAFLRIPQYALFAGDVQEAVLDLGGEKDARGGRFALSADDAPQEVLIVPPRLLGRAALASDQFGATWGADDLALREADEIQLRVSRTSGRRTIVSATRAWIEAHAGDGLRLDPTAPGSDGSFESITLRAEYVSAGARTFSSLELQ